MGDPLNSDSNANSVNRASEDELNSEEIPDFFKDDAEVDESSSFDDGFDLEQLSDQFDEKVSAEDPFDQRPAGNTPSKQNDEEEYFDVNPTSILEAMLFVGNSENQPITAKEMAALMRGVSEEDISELVAELNESYAADGTPFEITTRDGGYQMTITKEFESCRNVFYREEKAARLAQPVIDVLSLIAYMQPVSKTVIEEKRMKPCSSVLNQLVRRRLIEFERKKVKGEKTETIYRTSPRFLDLFGLNSLDELPKSQSFDS